MTNVFTILDGTYPAGEEVVSPSLFLPDAVASVSVFLKSEGSGVQYVYAFEMSPNGEEWWQVGSGLVDHVANATVRSAEPLADAFNTPVGRFLRARLRPAAVGTGNRRVILWAVLRPKPMGGNMWIEVANGSFSGSQSFGDFNVPAELGGYGTLWAVLRSVSNPLSNVTVALETSPDGWEWFPVTSLVLTTAAPRRADAFGPASLMSVLGQWLRVRVEPGVSGTSYNIGIWIGVR